MSPLRPVALLLMGAAAGSAVTDPIALNPAWSDHPTSPQQARVDQAPNLAKQFPMGVLGILSTPARPAGFLLAAESAALPKLTSAVRPGWSFTTRSTDRQWRPGGCEGLTNAVVAGRFEVYADNPADIAEARGKSRRPAGRDQVVALDTDTGTFSWLLPVPNDNHYYNTFRVNRSVVEVPFSPAASRRGKVYTEVWLRRFDLVAHTQEDVPVLLPPGAIAGSVWVSQQDFGKTTISVGTSVRDERPKNLAPATAEEAPPMVPFATQVTGSRYLVVGPGRKPIRRINPLRLSSEATYVIGVAGSDPYAEALPNLRGFHWGLGIAKPYDHWDWGLIEQPKKEFGAFLAGLVPTPQG